MGSSSSKESRRRGSGSDRQSSVATSLEQAAAAAPSENRPLIGEMYGTRSARGSRQELPLFFTRGHGRGHEAAAPREDRPRETKQEREARRAERERLARLAERERSLKEEHVDGGFLVTLGTYTGPEDFNKQIVRQLQIERRLAPFWRGLNDHSDAWTEHQLVAAARGQPIPAPDEIPPEMTRTGSQASSTTAAPESNIKSLTVPITSRSQSYESSSSARLSASHPAFSTSSGSTTPTTTQLLRGRAKTLASLATGSKTQPPSDLTPQEIRLPRDPFVNGTPLEAVLYKDAMECPICFLYYPPYLNKTRCCDQPICSECFVQIKRPDPHPPEHEQPGQERKPEEEAEQLVSEVAVCPFCVTPEFGVTYEPPPFRRGLAHAHQNNSSPFRNPTTAMSSSASLVSPNGPRRRATSLSANSAQVITTDRVRPDWAKKLADARANVLRRSAAATALHNAAYVLGNQSEIQLRGLPGFGRRRRTVLIETPTGSGAETPQRDGDDGNGDLYPDRASSRRLRTRVDDLEELMMMEAIRLSLATEEERKKKQEKEASKEQKRRDKEAKKEAKQAAKNRGERANSLYATPSNESRVSAASASTNMGQSSSNLPSQPAIFDETFSGGKGKELAQGLTGFDPSTETSSTLNADPTVPDDASPAAHAVAGAQAMISATTDPQRHLEESRANLQPTAAVPIPGQNQVSMHGHQLSSASSLNSSVLDSAPGSLQTDSQLVPGAADVLGTPLEGSGRATPNDATPLEPMFNFNSLAALVGNEAQAQLGALAGDTTSTDAAASTTEDGSLPVPSGNLSTAQESEFSDTNYAKVESSSDVNASASLKDGTSPPEGNDKLLSEELARAANEKADGSPSPQTAAAMSQEQPSTSKDIGQVNVLDHGHERMDVQ